MKLTIVALMVGAAAAFAPSNTVRFDCSAEDNVGRNPVAFFYSTRHVSRQPWILSRKYRLDLSFVHQKAVPSLLTLVLFFAMYR
jgi:light-harvesting complex I chlorophyll a/b binding protein 1